MDENHSYKIDLAWTGNRSTGTASYTSYDRSHEISADEKPIITCSADPAFRGDKSRYNPEELLVAALSSCHMLSYLHLCASSQVVVTGYTDNAVGTMIQTKDGGGHFTEVVLKPAVTIRKGREGSDSNLASELHKRAHELCFIANSVNFPVHIEPSIEYS